jgi:hypothetical protein
MPELGGSDFIARPVCDERTDRGGVVHLPSSVQCAHPPSLQLTVNAEYPRIFAIFDEPSRELFVVFSFFVR